MHVHFVLVKALFTVKRQEDQPEHVEGRQQRRGQAERVKHVTSVPPAVFTLEGAQQDRVLAEKSRKWRKSRYRESCRQHRQIYPTDLLAEPAHAVHVLLAAHGMNHAASREEEQGLEKRMRHQMKNPRRKCANAARKKHVTQ